MHVTQTVLPETFDATQYSVQLIVDARLAIGTEKIFVLTGLCPGLFACRPVQIHAIGEFALYNLEARIGCRLGVIADVSVVRAAMPLQPIGLPKKLSVLWPP